MQNPHVNPIRLYIANGTLNKKILTAPALNIHRILKHIRPVYVVELKSTPLT